jgi:hypothetical protein
MGTRLRRNPQNADRYDMNFKEWLKEERAVYYHGTTPRLLPAILSQGLIPNPKKRAWDNDTPSFNHASRASLPGIYVTDNILTASSSARHADQGSGKLIVVMDIHPYSLTADEDDFMNLATIEIPGLVANPYPVTQLYISWKIINTPNLLAKYPHMTNDKEYVTKAQKAYENKAIKYLLHKLPNIHPELEARIRSLITTQGFQRAIERQVAHVNPREFVQTCEREIETALPQPEIQTSEKNYSHFLDQITRSAKKITQPKHSKDRFQSTARILKPIGFNGKDKITCIFEVRESNAREEHVIIRYGHPPQKLISDWEKVIGPWRDLTNQKN